MYTAFDIGKLVFFPTKTKSEKKKLFCILRQVIYSNYIYLSHIYNNLHN